MDLYLYDLETDTVSDRVLPEPDPPKAAPRPPSSMTREYT